MGSFLGPDILLIHCCEEELCCYREYALQTSFEVHQHSRTRQVKSEMCLDYMKKVFQKLVVLAVEKYVVFVWLIEEEMELCSVFLIVLVLKSTNYQQK